MPRWTEEGWELLEGIALNAAVFTGFSQSGEKVIVDALRVCELINSSPAIGKKVSNIYAEERFWHIFHDGKILIWKLDSKGPLFVGAYYSMPELLLV